MIRYSKRAPHGALLLEKKNLTDFRPAKILQVIFLISGMRAAIIGFAAERPQRKGIQHKKKKR